MMRKPLTLEIFLNSGIPEFAKIEKEYVKNYWLKTANELIRHTVQRYRNLTFFPASTSKELIKYICLDSGILL